MELIKLLSAINILISYGHVEEFDKINSMASEDVNKALNYFKKKYGDTAAYKLYIPR